MTTTTIALPVANILLGSSIILSVAFFFYGLNILHLIRRARRYSEIPTIKSLVKPTVAIHLPIYNELYVIRRLLEACTKMASQYGKELVRIYIVDDSIDETSGEVDTLVGGFTKQGYAFRVIRRGGRDGFKAGALQAALDQTEEEFVAVFDADFVPPENFLEYTASHLANDESLGFVQCRWTHLDRGYNLVTESLAIGVDAHFLIEQRGRDSCGYLMNFNGSAGLLRRAAIVKAGGWESDTLAEDLDLSYRMQLAGYRGAYLNGLEVPGELPPTITSLKRQQGRWARGSLQTAKKLLGRIDKSKRLTTTQKFEAWIHLTYYLVHPLMVASFLLAVSATFLNIDVIKYVVSVSIPRVQSPSDLIQGLTAANAILVTVQFAPWLIFSLLIVLSTVAVLFYCVEAIRVQRLGMFENIKEVILLVLLGYGISISNSVQALSGILSKDTGTFLRTPKYAITGKAEAWQGKRYQIPLSATTILEGGGVFLASLAAVDAIKEGNVGIVPILMIYLIGYLLVFSLTILQTLSASGGFEH